MVKNLDIDIRCLFLSEKTRQGSSVGIVATCDASDTDIDHPRPAHSFVKIWS